MTSNLTNKVMTVAEAVDRFVHDDDIVGIGGQTTGRVSMAIAHEIVRQNKKNLNLVGCSMSMSMDIIVGAGLARRTECGTGNLEQYGTTMRWRRAIEEGRLEVQDYSHLAMAGRFLAGSLGVPFMPSKSMLGTDMLKKTSLDGHKAFEVINNPWDPDDPVVLLPAVIPDVSIIHVQKADEMGNVIIEGFTSHEPEMARASKSVIVSCEELVSSEIVRKTPERTTIPYIYIDAVVKQSWGAYPTSTYRYYEHDDAHLKLYQSCARAGGAIYQEYLKENIYDCATFSEFLDKSVGLDRLNELRDSMQRLL